MNYMWHIVLISFVIFGLFHSSTTNENQFTVSVDENSPVGSKIVSLRNKIKHSNSSVTFVPVSSEYFHLSVNGDITIKKPLDRDEDSKLCKNTGYSDVCSVTHVVYLRDGGIITVRIVVNDLNDNTPYWTEKIPSVSVSENSQINSEIDLPLAIDRDTKPNGIKKYKLLFINNKKYNGGSSAEFELVNRNSQNGVIPKLVIKKMLDREDVDKYKLVLVAIDGSAPFHTGTTTLYVYIADQNDNSPKFEKDTYHVKIFENFPHNTKLPINPKATDKDSGKLGEVGYRFSIATPEDVKKVFSINEKTGQIKVIGVIDYDSGKHSYEFVIVASDKGTPSLSSTAEVIVKIEDVNDQAPVITINFLGNPDTSNDNGNNNDKSGEVIRFQENQPSNKLVTTITVTDTDKGDGGKFNCSLLSSSRGGGASFMLQYYKGINRYDVYRLISTRSFDRETEPVVHCQVICEDKGKPAQTSRQMVNVNITDVNDVVPRFSEAKYEFKMFEGNNKNKKIGNVRAEDNDLHENGRVDYYIIGSESVQKLFKVKPDGSLIALEMLDREKNPEGFIFTVMAKDNGQPTLNDSREVQVVLKDINDCSPKFTEDEYKFAVEENDSDEGPFIVKTLGKISATDCDIGVNAHLTYRLKKRHSYFNITADGGFQLTHRVNRERQHFYKLEVLVVDSISGVDNLRNTASINVSVTIIDKNDNAPVFLQSTNLSYPIQVSYQENINTKIFKMYANDADSGANAILEFKIPYKNYKNFFTIDPQDGTIVIAKRMSSGDMGRCEITVVVSDGGKPQLSNEVQLTFIIDDSPPIKSREQLNSDGSASYFNKSFLFKNNRLIIILVVVGTVLICIILISVICVMTTGCRMYSAVGMDGGINRSRFHAGSNSDTDDPTKPFGVGITHACLPPYDIGSIKFSDVNESLLPPSSFYLINNNTNSHPISTYQTHPNYSYEQYGQHTIASPYGRPTPSESLEFSHNGHIATNPMEIPPQQRLTTPQPVHHQFNTYQSPHTQNYSTLDNRYHNNTRSTPVALATTTNSYLSNNTNGTIPVTSNDSNNNNASWDLRNTNSSNNYHGNSGYQSNTMDNYQIMYKDSSLTTPIKHNNTNNNSTFTSNGLNDSQ